MNFRKYNSIINHYNTKDIEYIIEKNFGRLPAEIIFEVTEKIHGSNFSILAENGQIAFAKRSALLNDNESFYGFQDVLNNDTYSPIFDKLKELSYSKGKLQLYGELFGAKIQKGVFYGNEKKFRWYALKIDGRFIPSNETDNLLADIIEYKVPVIGKYTYKLGNDIEEFINSIPYEFNSKLTPEGFDEKNTCEGVVAIPYTLVPIFNDKYFAIKKKNEEFIDKKSQKKRVKVKKEIPEDVQNLIDEFALYINDIRLNDLMSKMGEITSIQQIKMYAKEYFSDAMKDFMIDNKSKYDMLEKSFQKEIRKNVSRLIFNSLKAYLRS